MSMSMGAYQTQRMEQRMQLAQRMDMRLELRLELSLRQILAEHMLLDLEGVVDPGRVRIFDLPTGEGAIPIAAKLISSPADPYREAINMRACAERGIATPELMGVGESNGMFFMLTRFDPDVLNCATALSAGAETAQAYCKYAQGATLGDLPLENFTQNSLPDLHERVAIVLGREVARLHRAGIDKLDVTPRNLLLRLSPEGQVSFTHTGFREVAFADRSLPKRRRREQLEALQRAFSAINSDVTAQYSCSMIRGYFAEYYGRTLAGGEDPSAIQREVRTATDETLQQDDADMESPPSLTPMVVECRQIILDLPLDQLTTRKVGEAMCAIVERSVAVENIGYDEQRPRKQLRWLYERWKEKGSARLEDLECAPSDIATDGTTAGRLLKPIIESLGVPLPSDLLRSLREALVLRFAHEHPECSGHELFHRMRSAAPALMETLEIGSARTLRKYLKPLRDGGLVHDVSKRDAERVIGLIADWFNGGRMLDPRDCAAALGMDEAAVRPLVLCLKQRHLKRSLAAAHQSHATIDIAALACVLDLPLAEVEEAAIKTRISPAPGNAERSVASLPETSRVEHAVTAPVEEEHREAEVTPAEQEHTAAPPVPPIQPVMQVQETTEENLDEKLLRAIEEDGTRSDGTLAQMCGCSVTDVQSRIRGIVASRHLDGRRSEVERLIQTQPGIEDDGIQERTGLPVVDIHLILRPLLQNGNLRTGRPLETEL